MNQSSSSDPAGHSADLRTRIVSVLQYAVGRQGDWKGLVDCVDLADAVIKELGMASEGKPNRGGGYRIRYVTEWTESKSDD